MDNKKPFRKAFTESASRKEIGIFSAAIFVIFLFRFLCYGVLKSEYLKFLP